MDSQEALITRLITLNVEILRLATLLPRRSASDADGRNRAGAIHGDLLACCDQIEEWLDELDPDWRDRIYRDRRGEW
jgi:hypothetical protein